MKTTENQFKALERDITKLLKMLKRDIGDEYRACEDDETPGMQVTVGATPDDEGRLNWSYQTGDNSYSGGAYGHRHWGVIYLYRRSNSADLAHAAVEEIADSIASMLENQTFAARVSESESQAWESTTKVYAVNQPIETGESFRKINP